MRYTAASSSSWRPLGTLGVEARMRSITLYTRPGCHLCEDAAELLERLARRFAIQVDEVDILGDVDLYERYKHSIPVIAIAGGPALCAPIRADALERALVELST